MSGIPKKIEHIRRTCSPDEYQMTSPPKEVFNNPILTFVLLVLCVLLIVRRRPSIALGVFCATIWLSYLYPVGPTRLVWILLFTSLASFVTYVDPLNRSRRRLLKERDMGVVVWLLLLTFWMLVRFYVGPRYDGGLQMIKNHFIYNLLPFSMLSLLAVDLSQVKRFTYSYVVTTLLIGFISIVIMPDLAWRSITEGATVRFSGLAPFYMVFAYPFGISSVLILVIMMQARFARRRMLMVILFVVNFVFMSISQHRQTFIAAVVSCIVLAIWSFKNRKSTARLIWVSIFLIFIFAWGPVNWTTLEFRYVELDIKEIFGIGGRSNVDQWFSFRRIVYWKQSFNSFLNSPLWGNGLRDPNAGRHNLFLDIMADQGAVGLVLFLGFLISCLRYSRGIWTSGGDSDLALWRAGAFALFIFGMVQQQFSGGLGGTFQVFFPSVLMWRLGVLAQRKGLSNPISVLVNEPASS